MVRQIQPGEKIGEADCPACGLKLAVKVNRNKCVYTRCDNVLRRDEKGKAERCYFRVSYGKDHSRKMIEEFLAREIVVPEKEGEPEHVQTDNRPGLEDVPEPRPAAAGKPDDRPRRGALATILFGEE